MCCWLRTSSPPGPRHGVGRAGGGAASKFPRTAAPPSSSSLSRPWPGHLRLFALLTPSAPRPDHDAPPGGAAQAQEGKDQRGPQEGQGGRWAPGALLRCLPGSQLQPLPSPYLPPARQGKYCANTAAPLPLALPILTPPTAPRPPPPPSPAVAAAKSPPSGGTKKARKKKDKDAPKKGLSAFMFYSAAVRDQVKADNPGISFGEVRGWGRRGEGRRRGGNEAWVERAGSCMGQWQRSRRAWRARLPGGAGPARTACRAGAAAAARRVCLACSPEAARSPPPPLRPPSAPPPPAPPDRQGPGRAVEGAERGGQEAVRGAGGGGQGAVRGGQGGLRSGQSGRRRRRRGGRGGVGLRRRRRRRRRAACVYV